MPNPLGPIPPKTPRPAAVGQLTSNGNGAAPAWKTLLTRLEAEDPSYAQALRKLATEYVSDNHHNFRLEMFATDYEVVMARFTAEFGQGAEKVLADIATNTEYRQRVFRRMDTLLSNPEGITDASGAATTSSVSVTQYYPFGK